MYGYLFIFVFAMGVNSFGLRVMMTDFSLSRGYSLKTWSLALLESAHILLLFLRSVPLLCSCRKPLWHHTKLSAILLCKCFAFIESEMHFCMKL